MKRSLLAFILLSASPRFAQSGKIYRDLFRAWKDSDPTLEKDAAKQDRLAERAKVSGQAASSYAQARQAYFRSLVDESSDLLLWLQDSSAVIELDLSPASDLQALV